MVIEKGEPHGDFGYSRWQLKQPTNHPTNFSVEVPIGYDPEKLEGRYDGEWVSNFTTFILSCATCFVMV